MEVINVVEQGSVIKKTDIQFCIYKEGVLNERIPYFKVVPRSRYASEGCRKGWRIQSHNWLLHSWRSGSSGNFLFGETP